MAFKWPAEWRDPDAMSYFISNFATSNIRPARKLSFWSNLICKVCQYRKTPFVTVSELKRCLAWRGMPPLCLEGVLDDMESKRTVLKLHKLTETWSRWGFDLLAYPVTSIWRKIANCDTEQTFVVVSVLEECRYNVFQDVHQNDIHLFQVEEWNAVVEKYLNPRNIVEFNNYLVFLGDIILHGDPVSLVKVRTKCQKKVDPFSQVDLAIGKAQATKDILVNQIKSFDSKIDECTTQAKAANNKYQALGYLRRRKMYQKSLVKWEGTLSNTESLLIQLQDSQHHKTVISTLKTGADALQQNKVSLKELDDIMDQLDDFKNYEEELNSAFTSDSSNVSLDESLALELEKLLEDEEPPAKKQNRNSVNPSEKSVVSEVIDLTKDASEENTTQEIRDIELMLQECPEPPSAAEIDSSILDFENTEHPIDSEMIPQNIKAKLSPELRRKPGRKLVGHLAE